MSRKSNIYWFQTIFCVCLPLILLTDGCRKGEEDPWLSLRSRKSRLTGEWALTSSEGHATDSIITHAFNGETYIDYFDADHPDTSSYSETLTIEDDNTYTWNWSGSHRGLYHSTTFSNTEGNWYFLNKSKDQDYKNKERIAFQKIKDETGYSDDIFGVTSWIYWYTGDRDDNLTTYAIQGLSNKRLTLTFSYTAKSSEGMDKAYTETRVFEKL